jgi:peroxiredoxin
MPQPDKRLRLRAVGAAAMLLLGRLPSAMGAAPAPRISPELTISEPSGRTERLSSYRGKVVVLAFIFAQSDHCIRVARMLNSLQQELGPRGFQPLGIVFDPPNVPGSSSILIPPLVRAYKLSYPVGYATKEEVDRYLGRSDAMVLNIPQVVVIDREGAIRASSGGAGGDPKLENEPSLRGIVDDILNPPGSSKKGGGG